MTYLDIDDTKLIWPISETILGGVAKNRDLVDKVRKKILDSMCRYFFGKAFEGSNTDLK